MKFLTLCIVGMLCVPLLVLADNPSHTEFIENIKKEHGIVFDILFLQARETLKAKEDIVMWLYHKNKAEFKTIQNLMTDLKVEVGFNHNDEHIIKKELEDSLKEKIQDEAQKVLDMDGVTAENMKDFFHISRMICGVTLESDDACCRMTRALQKEYRLAIKELKAIDKAAEKIKNIDKKRTKQALLHKLREQIILGTSPRK